MKFSIISDVHVKNPGDNAEILLLAFLQNPDVMSSDGIFLLGDIFDLMIGPHSQYFSRFNKYFQTLKALLEANKKIYYVEGNHDFHLRLLYKKFFDVHNHLDSTLFNMGPEFILKDESRSIYFAHGDDIELGNDGYKKYKSIVTSLPLKYAANYLIPYFVMKGVGESSSQKSRERNNIRYSKDAEVESIKINFRNSAEEFYKNNKHDIYVLGHSHVQDHYTSTNQFQYANNGYAQHTQTYISIENGIVSFKPVQPKVT